MEDIRKGTCPVCAHNEIVETTPGIALHQETEQVPFLKIVKERPVVRTGELHTYVCRRCGYVQSYANAPEEIPIGDTHHTRLITGPEPAGPYR